MAKSMTKRFRRWPRCEIPISRDIRKGYRDNYAKTAPMGSFSPIDLGLFDVSGNVRLSGRFHWTPDGLNDSC